MNVSSIRNAPRPSGRIGPNQEVELDFVVEPQLGPTFARMTSSAHRGRGAECHNTSNVLVPGSRRLLHAVRQPHSETTAVGAYLT